MKKLPLTVLAVGFAALQPFANAQFGSGIVFDPTQAGHAVTLFEANDSLGGHTHTVDVTRDGITAPVDTGFLVFNDRTYPKLVALFEELGVASVASQMTFSARIDAVTPKTLQDVFRKSFPIERYTVVTLVPAGPPSAAAVTRP